MIREGRHIPEMYGRQVFRMAVTKLPEVVHEILDANGLRIDDVSLLIAHQANLRINEMVQRALELPDEKVFNNIQRYANTTAATAMDARNETFCSTCPRCVEEKTMGRWNAAHTGMVMAAATAGRSIHRRTR